LNKGDDFYKCSICSKIYGTRVGEMPPGTMSWRYSPTTYISGSNSSGGYTIIYNIRSGVKNGTTF